MLKPIHIVAILGLCACSPSPPAYTEDGTLILPMAPSTAIAERAPIDRALAARINRYDRDSNLNAAGATTLATALICAANDCNQQITREVFIKSSIAAVAASDAIPFENQSPRQSETFIAEARARTEWIEEILEISNAYVAIAKRDWAAIDAQNLDQTEWVALYQTRIANISDAITKMGPVVLNLQELGQKTRHPDTRPTYLSLSARARSALGETIRNRDRLQAMSDARNERQTNQSKSTQEGIQ